MNKIIAGIITLIALISCSKAYDDLANPNSNNTDVELIADSVAFNNLRNKSVSDKFKIDSAYLIEDWMICNVSFSGGCANHHFKAYWNQQINTDSLAETKIILTHDARNDTCEAYISQEININLKWLTNSENSVYNHIIYHIINNSTNEVYTLE